jgi:pimeloyl-[acyl-carrier protein] methyl ester esterase
MRTAVRVNDLVLLHGWGAGAGIWREFAQRLARRFRVHALDLPGYGAQPACIPYTLDTLVDRVACLAPRRCGVIGWSLGGQVALAWARRAPRQVQRLALIGATPSFTRRPGWSCATAPEVLEEFGNLLTADRAGTLARFSSVQARGDARARRVAGVLRRLNESDTPIGALLSGLAILSGADQRRDLRRIRQPALVLHGARDRIVPAAAGRRLAAALPHARFQHMRGCAHAPFLSQPARVALLLREFFDE